MQKYKNAAEGLNLMFIAAIGTIVCTVLMFIPIIGTIFGGIGSLVFAILVLVGLSKAGRDIEGCKKAFTMSIVNIGVSFLAMLVGKIPALALLVSIASDVVAFLIVYYVCSSVAEAVREAGANDVADSGEKVYKINFYCYVAAIVLGILAFIPFLGILAGICNFVVGIVMLVAEVMYLIFLNKSSKVLAE